MATSVYTYGITPQELADDSATTINSTSRPTEAATLRKIRGLCAQVNTELEALGVNPSSITGSNDANLYHKIRDWIIEEAGAWWHSVNLRDETDYASARQERWTAFQADVRSKAAHALGESGPARARAEWISNSLRTAPAEIQDKEHGFN